MTSISRKHHSSTNACQFYIHFVYFARSFHDSSPVCTQNRPPRRVLMYKPSVNMPSLAFPPEICTENPPCSIVLPYKRGSYIGSAVPIVRNNPYLCSPFRSPSERPHRPGGEMVDTRDLKSLGPKRPCGFDSRPGHRKDFASC